MPSKLTTPAHLAKQDREIDAIRKLHATGMKMLVRIGGNLSKLEGNLSKLEASQRETDRQLQVLIRSLQRGTSGHSQSKVDIQ